MSKTSQMLIGCAAFTASLLVINPTVSQAQTAPQQVTAVRVGDRQMSCEALASEINQLASADAPAAKPKKKRGGMGFMRMLSAASPLLGMGGGMAGAVASQAAGVAAQEAAQSSVDDAMDASLQMMNAGNSPAQQRKARLTSIFEEKRC